MNKFFTKIASLSVGLALAIGVGVAIGNNTSKAVKADDSKDTITAADLTATDTTYKGFSGVTKTSDAVYAGQSAKDSSGNIQLRSKNSNSGIVSTASGGTVKSVKITVGSGSNSVDVYGSNTAYTAATDLYGSSKGTKVGSLTATGTITFTDDYAYVGIRSNSGAIYLSSVEITWTVESAEPFTVSFNKNNTACTQNNPDPITEESAGAGIEVPASMSATNYTFVGWNTKQDGSGDTYTAGQTFKPSSNCTLYGKWSKHYTVSFNTNNSDCTGSRDPITQTAPNAAITLPAALSCDGYTWNGWNTNEAGTGTTYNAGSSYTPTADVTLFGKWTKHYTVTFNSNYPTGIVEATGSVPSPITQSSGGQELTIPTCNLSSTSHTFISWNTDASGTGASYGKEGSAKITPSADITLYAIWTINTYNVTSSIEHGSISVVSPINYGGDLIAQITPESEFYSMPTIDDITVTMGGTDITDQFTDYDNDGYLAYEGVTGAISITATCPERPKYTITTNNHNHGTIEGDDYIFRDLESSQSFTLTAAEHYKLPQTITITSGETVLTDGTDYTYVGAGGDSGLLELTVTSNYSGNIAIDVNFTQLVINTFDYSSLSHVVPDPDNPTSVEEKSNATLVFTAEDGYYLTDTYSVTGASGEGTWTPNVTEGSLTVTGGTSKTISMTIGTVEKVLTGLTISENEGTFYLGHDFEKPTVTATFNNAYTEDVTALAEVSGYDKYTLTDEDSPQTVTISFKYKNVTLSQTYEAYVVVKPTQSEGYYKIENPDDLVDGTYIIVNESSSMALSTTQNTKNRGATSVTINNGYIASIGNTVQVLTLESTILTDEDEGDYTVWSFYTGAGYLYAASSSDNTLKTQTNNDSNGLWYIYEIDGGGYNIHAQGSNSRDLLRYNSTSSLFSCYASGQSITCLYQYREESQPEAIRITATPKQASYYVGQTLTSNDFTVTIYYDDGNSDVVTEGITLERATLLIDGTNVVTVNYGDFSIGVNVTAITQEAELDHITWNQGNIIQLETTSLSYASLSKFYSYYVDVDDPIERSVNDATLGLYRDNSGEKELVKTITDGYTWSLNDDNLYLGIVYEENDVSCTAYGGVVSVVEKLNEIHEKDYVYSYSTLATSLSNGDSVVFTANTKPLSYEMGTYNSDKSYFSLSEITGSNPAGTMPLLVVEGNKTGSFSFKTSSNKYLSYSGSSNAIYLSDTISNDSSWYVTFSNEDNTASIINVTTYDSSTIDDRYIQFNSTNSRIACYKNTQANMLIYKGSGSYVPKSEDIANKNLVVQKEVLDFVKTLNEKLAVCSMSGTNPESLADAWTQANIAYTTALNKSSDSVTFAKLLANATSTPRAADGTATTGDSLQNALARYDYIISTYGESTYSDFLGRINAGSLIPPGGRINLNILAMFGKNPNLTIVVILSSIVAIGAFAGYFYYKKKKED